MLCDSVTGYILNIIVYTGQSEEDDSNGDKQPISMKTVMKLMKSYLDKGHYLFVDNYYTSPLLFRELFIRKTGACGTVKPNRRGMPNFPSLKKGETAVRFLMEDDLTALALKWCDKRDVHMLSSIHSNSFEEIKRIKGKKEMATERKVMAKKAKKDNKGAPNKGETVSSELTLEKPHCISQYNKHMGYVDKVDMQLSFTDSNKKVMKWYKKVVFHFINLMLYNAYVLFKLVQKNPKMQFRLFLKNVIRQIIEKYGLHRKRRAKVKESLTTEDARLKGRHFPSVHIREDGKKTQRKCFVHSKTSKGPSSRKETIYECKTCDVPLCVVPCFEVYHTTKNF